MYSYPLSLGWFQCVRIPKICIFYKQGYLGSLLNAMGHKV